MTAGSRVGWHDDVMQLGTVESVSPAGYVSLRWDIGTLEIFSAHEVFKGYLRVVTGDAALPRHDWAPFNDDSPCVKCGAAQTETEYTASCRAVYVMDADKLKLVSALVEYLVVESNRQQDIDTFTTHEYAFSFRLSWLDMVAIALRMKAENTRGLV